MDLQFRCSKFALIFKGPDVEPAAYLLHGFDLVLARIKEVLCLDDDELDKHFPWIDSPGGWFRDDAGDPFGYEGGYGSKAQVTIYRLTDDSEG